ncbi:MAG: amidohydrolase [Oligoflexus sp.]
MKFPCRLLPSIFFTVAYLVLPFLAQAEVKVTKKIADTIFENGRIYTFDAKGVVVQGLALKDGRIIGRGSKEQLAEFAGKNTRRIDLKGRMVTPGLHEGHGHLLRLGLQLIRLDLAQVASLEDVLTQVKKEKEQRPKGQWIQGRGWDQNLWPQKDFPSKIDLDQVSREHPIYLGRVDGHAAWVNSRALELAGITAQTPDPEGGRILRDKDGQPTGILIDRAMGLVSRLLPAESEADMERAILAAVELCNRLGITSFHDAGSDRASLQILQNLIKDARLTMRVNAMLLGSDQALIDDYLARGPQSFGDNLLQIRSVKLMADGALGSRGAALLEAYSDEPHHHGIEILSEQEIYQLTKRLAKAGFQAATHAIGDKTNRSVLNAYERVMREEAGRDLRLRIEHAQILHPDDIERFGQLGVIASMQSTHLTSDAPWVPTRLGDERTKAGAYVWQKIKSSGARLVGGSDAPVESVNPMWGLYAAVTRQNQKGQPKGGWAKDQRLSMAEALETYTVHAAYAAFWENDLGTLEAGKYADLVVFESDLFRLQQEPRKLLEDQVWLTMLAGEIVYQRGGDHSH